MVMSQMLFGVRVNLVVSRPRQTQGRFGSDCPGKSPNASLSLNSRGFGLRNHEAHTEPSYWLQSRVSPAGSACRPVKHFRQKLPGRAQLISARSKVDVPNCQHPGFVQSTSCFRRGSSHHHGHRTSSRRLSGEADMCIARGVASDATMLLLAWRAWLCTEAMLQSCVGGQQGRQEVVVVRTGARQKRLAQALLSSRSP